MTPYAVLMVRPTDGDDTVRRAFHALARTSHPDSLRNGGEPGAEWHAAAAAYSAVKTAELRDRLDRYMRGLSGFCDACRGSGVRGTRAAGAKLRLCDRCGGEGRVR